MSAVDERVVVSVVLPECRVDRLSQGLRALTRVLEQAGYPNGGCGLGGRYGYANLYTSDLFNLHPYCWCEREDGLCPWCSGCLRDADFPDPVHTSDCYQTHLDALKRKHGRLVAGYWVAPCGNKRHDAAVEKLCVRMGLPYPHGSAVHCTCGASDRYRELRDACDCDSCAPAGIFAEAGATDERGAPLFWHKPSGVRVWWYKYIGRGMEVYAPEGARVLSAVREAINHARALPRRTTAPV